MSVNGVRMEDLNELELLHQLALENISAEDRLNIVKMAAHFKEYKNVITSGPEFAALQARYRVIASKTKIRELQLEIEKLESDIRNDERVIRRSKRTEQLEKSKKGKGRPVRSEFTVNIAKSFVSKWVGSLMLELGIDSCQKLEQLISPHCYKYELHPENGNREKKIISTRATERNLRRWLNGEALLNFDTFENLRLAKIEFGDRKGKLLVDIQTTPSAHQLHTLLMYI